MAKKKENVEPVDDQPEEKVEQEIEVQPPVARHPWAVRPEAYDPNHQGYIGRKK